MEIISKDGFGNSIDVNNLFDAILLQNFSKIFFLKIGIQNENFNLFEDEYLGVKRNDVVTINKSIFPKIGMLSIVEVNSVFVLCRYVEHKGERYFVCGAGSKNKFKIFKEKDIFVFGTVISVIKNNF